MNKIVQLEDYADIMLSNWCVMCKQRAQYIYKGNSLCPKHFEKELAKPERKA